MDDEAIPLVYARNLVRGRGLVYTALEGHAEGYSDFLHVLWSALVLMVTRGLHMSLLAPMAFGKAVSFAAGIGVVIVTARWLRRTGVTTPGLVAALGFLALAGPLAVWSCSSLETTLFALMVTGFAVSVQAESLAVATGLGALVVFERLDGIVFVAVILLAALAAEPGRRRTIWNLAWPVCLIALAFHAWRFSFFGSLLSEPLAAKVLYRLTGSAHAIVKSPDVPYLRGLLQVYGIPAAPALIVAAGCAWRVRAARTAAIAVAFLGLYVALVGDWMFGWRFAVALYPLAAVTIGVAVSRAPRTLGWCVAAGVILWSAAAARNVLNAYVTAESKPIFWAHPTLGAATWLAPYYDLIAASRPLMHAGDRVAYNQAGLLPYLLDLENVDDLGICSRFVARLPTTDIYYTAVGKYSPLTNQPVLHTAHAYLLYEDVQFVIARADLLRKANANVIPPVLLDDFFSLATLDASGGNAIYRRSGKPAEAYRRDPATFSENVAHTSRLTRVAIDGKALTPEAFGPELPFLRGLGIARRFPRDLEIDLAFGPQDADVSALYIGAIASKEPCTITLALFDAAGHETLRRILPVAQPTRVLERFETPVRARSAYLKFDTAQGDRLTIEDVRILGQSPALRDYVRRNLRFPAP